MARKNAPHSPPFSENKKDNSFFGISPEFREYIEQALNNHKPHAILKAVASLHAADMADLINLLSQEDRRQFIQIVKETLKPEVLLGVDPAFRREVINVLSVSQIVSAIEGLDSDDILELLEGLDEKLVFDILGELQPEDRAAFEHLLSYPEKSAGRLMQREVVCVPPFWTLEQVSSFVRESKDLPRFFYDIFVVDLRHHPIGKVPLSQLVRHKPDTKVSEIMETGIHTFPVAADQEEVGRAFQHYTLVSAPVVSSSGRVVGMITLDDVVDVIEEEAEEDILHMHRVHGASDFYAPVATTAYWRIRWLLITIVNTLMASYVISHFEASIQKITALSFLMTINAAMGGNSGMQVVTVVVRALATRDLREEDTWRAVRKEIGVGLLVGSFCALILGIIASLWIQSISLGLVLFSALLANMLWAAFAGTMLPIIVHRLGMDPAVSSGPILTTTTDVLGYAIFLWLATFFLV